MVSTFVKRWLMLRKLYKYIYISDTLPLVGEATHSKESRIRRGIPKEEFILLLKMDFLGIKMDQTLYEQLENGNQFPKKIFLKLPWNKNKYNLFRELSNQTLKECIDIGYIDNTSDWLKVGTKGMEVRAWYYPAIAFFNLHYSKIILTRLLEWGLPLGVIYIFSKYLHITITASAR